MSSSEGATVTLSAPIDHIPVSGPVVSVYCTDEVCTHLIKPLVVQTVKVLKCFVNWCILLE